MKRIHYYSHRGRGKHLISFVHHLSTNLLLPLIALVAIGFATTGAFFFYDTYAQQGLLLVGALLSSTLRLLIAYVLSLAVGVPLAIFAVKNRRVESILLPIYDVLESMPVLAFFPVIILFFVASGFLEGAAIFILFFSIIWNVVFNVIGGMKTIPHDVLAVGNVFGLTWFQRFRKVTLPALFPSIVTASILSIAEGWNLVIVAEALHAYVPRGANAEDLFGIGSILVDAAASGNTQLLIAATSVLVVAIVLINIFVWQPLLARSARYKFD